MSAAEQNTGRRRTVTWRTFVLLGLLAWHAWAVSIGWGNLNLPGNEFRQTQTAISAYFIQQDRDFSLAYPTPVLGKPWSIPMEFPLYQWTVVGLSDATGLSLTAAGRTVSVACFYLFLPALMLLLRRLGQTATARLAVLGLLLTSPIYIFFARAFLIETMALLFGAWYLAALVEARERWSRGWLAVAIVAGVGAGLVKVTTYLVFLLPAAGWSVWWLWQDRPTRASGAGPLGRTLLWLAGVHAIPFAATLVWLHFADAVKTASPAGECLVSANLTVYNFGVGRRFDPQLWKLHGELILGSVAGPWAVLLGVGALGLARFRGAAVGLGCVAVFFAVQAVFPLLYAWHDYYYVAIAFLLLTAIGLALARVVEAGRSLRWFGAAASVAVLSLQVGLYLRSYFEIQRVPSDGTSALHQMVREYVAPADVLLVAGDDWSSIIPYYTRRRALMIMENLEREPARLQRAFEGLRDEKIGMLILKGKARSNRALVEAAVGYFGVADTPALTTEEFDVYSRADQRDWLLARVADRTREPNSRYRELQPYAGPPVPPLLTGRVVRVPDLAPRQRELFGTMQPRPERFVAYATPAVWPDGGGVARFFAHPELRLWFAVPPGAHRLCTEFGLEPGAYENLRENEASDGVELVATIVAAGGGRVEVARRRLDPAHFPGDRGPQTIDWTFVLGAGEELELAVLAGPAGDIRRDWATLGPLRIE